MAAERRFGPPGSPTDPISAAVMLFGTHPAPQGPIRQKAAEI
jgi:hypothetical protein